MKKIRDPLQGEHLRTLSVFLLCSLTACLFGMASPKLNWHPLCWILLVPFLLALEGAGMRRGFTIGWLCGTMIHLVCFPWIVGTIQRYSNLNLTLSILAWILFSLYSGLAFGGMSVAHLLVTRRSLLPAFLALPICYTAMEFLFPFIFPWHLGACLYPVLPLIQISDLFGVFGVTGLLVTANAAFFEIFRFLMKRQPFPFASAALSTLLVAASLSYGYWRMDWIHAQQEKSSTLTVGIVQANVLIEEKRTPLLQEDIWRRYRELSLEAIRQNAQMIVWPESAVQFPFRPQSGPHSASAYLKEMIRSFGTPVLFGSWAIEVDGPRNTAYLLDTRGEVAGRYDKVHLLAFGEFMPFSDSIPQLKGLVQGVGDFRAGERAEPLCWNGSCFGVLICYEAVLKSLPRKLINLGGQFLVNITNDVWFGDTNCPEQHLMLASFRAVENRVWLVRAANTGISAFVDPTGRILNRTALFRQAVRVSRIQTLGVPTLYKSWGDWFPVSCSLLLVLLLAPGLLAEAREQMIRKRARREAHKT